MSPPTGSEARIVRVEVQRVEDVPLTRPLQLAWDPGVVRTSESFTIVRVHDDAGRMGIGEGGRGGALRAAAGALVGLGLFDDERLAAVRQDTGGGFGIDTALCDLQARARGTSLVAHWGGRADRVRAYAATVEVGTPDQRAEDALGFVAEGFRGLKLRLHAATIEEDLALARTVRDAVGERLVLMADANQGRAAQRGTAVRWTYERALATARALGDLGFAWLEEPLAIDDLDGLARLRRQAAIAIAGGERDATPAAFEALVKAGAYDVLQPDGMVVGSVDALRAIAALAGGAAVGGPQLVLHHGGGGVGAVAHLHLSAAVGAPWFEVIRDRPGEPPWPAQWVPRPPISIDGDGDVHVPAGAGLGITVDDELLDRYTVARRVFG